MEKTEAATAAAPAQRAVFPPAPEPRHELPKAKAITPVNVPAIVVGAIIAAVAVLSVYYLVRGEPLLVQGEADATRFDIAARVDGRVGEVPVTRGQDVA